jgi:uncharacterized protein YecE (DUF72 family)
MAGAVRIGTSGWEYRHWEGRFYPRDLPRDQWLEHYAAEFETVELNNSFYRLPGADQFARWGHRVARDFRFAVKASRYLTHVKRLRDPAQPLERLWTRARHLGPRLGPMLYQLPPRWKPDLERIAAFLAAVPDAAQAIEFRDRSWYGDATYRLLERARVAICLHDMAGSATEPRPVGPLVYIRFHGSGQKYGGSYSPHRLSAWADRIAGWASDGLPVWAYFNNDAAAHAIRDADRLRSYVRRRLAS